MNRAATEKCGVGYEVVDVVTSPGMLVHWAMQYAGFCEMLDEEVRGKIREEMKVMEEKYGI